MFTSPYIPIDVPAMQNSIGTIDAHTGEVTDPYTAEAAKVFIIPEQQVTPKMREYVKHCIHQESYKKSFGSGATFKRY